MSAVLSLYKGTFLLILLNQRSETGVFGVGLTFSLGFFGIYVAVQYFFPREWSARQVSNCCLEC